jgi:hypothetical protein
MLVRTAGRAWNNGAAPIWFVMESLVADHPLTVPLNHHTYWGSSLLS